MSKLVILVLTWNNADDSIECIESLMKQRTKPFTILSVDNNSTDDSADRMESFAASKPDVDIRCIRNLSNNGTAGGFNVALRWALENNYKFVGTLNADAVADPNWVEALMQGLKNHPEAGIVTGLMLRRDKITVDTSGDFYTIWGLPGPRGRDSKIDKVPQEQGEVFGSTGGGFLARVSAVAAIGLFDEKYFMYYEDVDYSFRAQLQGYRVFYIPEAKAFHKLSASSKTVPGLAVYNTFKNLPMLLWRNVPLGLLPKILPRFLLGYCLILGNAICNKKAAPALKGFAMSMAYLPHALWSRRAIQKKKTVSTDYISSIILHDLPPDQKGLRKFRKLFTRYS